MAIDSDSPKLDAIISFRIPERVKRKFDALPMQNKHVAYERMRVEVARAIYEAGFDPYVILDEE